MAEGLTAPLRAALVSSGHTLTVDYTRGTTTRQWLGKRIEAADFYMIALGTNDAYNGVAPNTAASNALGIIASLGGIPFLWAGAPANYNHAATVQAIADTVYNYFDARTLSLPLRDGVHPTAGGFQTWARELANRVGSGRVETNYAPAYVDTGNYEYDDGSAVDYNYSYEVTPENSGAYTFGAIAFGLLVYAIFG